MDYGLWLKDTWERLKYVVLTAWGLTYTVFHYLFHPTRAWNAAWLMFMFAFVTKMVQMSYEERGFWSMLRHRFSAKVAVEKAMPRVIFYLALMFGVARGRDIFPNTITDNMHTVFTSFVFALELINSLQHLSGLPNVKVDKFIDWIKKTLMPKGFGDD